MKNTAILQKVESLLQQMTLEEKIGQLNQTGTTMVSALPGIEADIETWVSDMLEGRLSQEEFGKRMAMSCSWDMSAFHKMAKVAKKEAKISGVNWVFGPMLDIARDGRWGRIVESPGEDVYLACKIAETMIIW